MSQKPMSQKPMSQKPMSQKPMSQKPMSQKSMSQKPMSQKPMSQKPMSQSGPPLVVFDLGRVLVRICDGWSEAFSQAGLGHLVAAVEERLRDRPRRGALSQLVFALERGAITPERFCADSAVLLERGPDEVARTLDAYVCGGYPGAVELLDELTARGISTACLSNTNARHWELMGSWQAPADRIFSRLGLRLGSHELAARKPEAEVYVQLERRAAAQLDGDPGRVIFFDDLPDNVAAARARGWRAIEVRSREAPIAEMRTALVGLGVV